MTFSSRPILACTFTLAAFAASCNLHAQDLIIEAGQGGKNASQYAETSGEWADSGDAKTERSSAPGLTQADKCKARKLATGQGGEARFYPRFSAAGHYCVYITYPSSANAKQVLYVTHCDGNSSAKSVIQNGVGYHNPANGNKWVYLGEWDFKEGGDDYVALVVNPKETTPNDPNKNGVAFADAVRFTAMPLTANEGADLFPRDRVEMRALGASVPSGAAVLLGAKPKAGKPAGAAAASATGKSAAAPAAIEAASMPIVGAGQAPGSSSPAGGLEWMDSIQAAQQLVAGDSSKRILIYFHSGDNAQCTKLDNEVFTNADVHKLLKDRYALVRLEMDRARELATALQVSAPGALLVYDNAGNGIKKVEAPSDAAELSRELQF
jgi:hypothetical protein